MCPGVTVIVGGVVLKLQLFCMRSEHRMNDENMRGQEPGHWGMEKTIGRGGAWPQ